MNTKRCLVCTLMFWLFGWFGAAHAREPNKDEFREIDSGPVKLYLQKGQRPVVLFTTPCLELARIDHGLSPFALFREVMAHAVLEVNKVLPLDVQPVCM
jgi:hypothetical protein